MKKRDNRPQDDGWQDYPEDFSVHYDDDFGDPAPQDDYGYDDSGYNDGYADDDSGYDGYDDGSYNDNRYDDGYGGYDDGYDNGYDGGYDDGYDDGGYNSGGYQSDNGYDNGYDNYDDGGYGDEPPEPSRKQRRRKDKGGGGKPPKKKRHPIGCLWSILWKLLILAVVAVIGFTGFLFARLESVDFPSGSELGANTSVSQFGVYNIALFGVDARDYSTNARSDAIMILTVDTGSGKLKLSTLMRDTLVSVPGYGDMKLTEAYAYGGPELAVQTINQNFGLDITEYATVTFKAMAEIIDAAGGVEVELTEEERVSANGSIWEQWDACGMDADYIDSAGKQVLSGTQAVAYARIRHVGNADYQRTSRQRIVLTALIDQLLSHPTRVPQTLMTAEDVVETSLSQGDLMKLMPVVLHGVQVESTRFPVNADIISDSYYVGNAACIYADMDATRQKLHDFIYNDIDPTTDSDRRSNGEDVG